uniref:Reverse transcriptase domain-containing protein n=1 Tax=Tanacetum cinerariifolium TaxID=118510 RepID=A0A6L2L9X3_TANCI|nr:hypothetical protein [Tanacetum cinerariifolium]
MIVLHDTFQAWLQQRQDQVVNLDSSSLAPSQCRKIPIYYDDDDDEESSTLLRDIIISELPLCIAITPVLSTEEPKDSLIMGDEHLDTNPEKESDEFIKSSVENLVPSLSEFEDLSKDLSDIKMTTSHFLMRTFDSLLEEFSSELSHIDLISLEFDEANLDPEEEICLVKKLLHDSMPPGIENDDYDSKGDILVLAEMLSNDSPSLSENKSFNFDVPSSLRPLTKPPDVGFTLSPIQDF